MSIFKRKKTEIKPCPTYYKYMFAKSFFHGARRGVSMGVMEGRRQVRNYMNGAWWNNDPKASARNILRNWGAL
ncbi:hypothetical protein [Pantoea anthophila]|uniref:hypothetical protein n=1 Tax=Pantoea anthophila TaxID=470931 RepID=UPI002DBE553C|nr:hypothetical protein [Pantoea anthophila]MEB6223737.1 hypothetical protein [Pantoea anthophila]